MALSKRQEHEIIHGQKLAAQGAETIWGWGTPAGQLRAKRRAERIIAAANLRPGMRVLEIGCGTGNFTEIFAQTGAHITAVDISSELVDLARSRHLPENVTVMCAAFEELDTNQPFDAVIGSSILHHLDIQQAVQQIYKLLRSGGVMAFAEPNMLNPQVMVQKNIPWIKARLGDSPDETAFFRWQIKRILLNAGFSNVVVEPLDWLHPGVPPAWIRAVLGLETGLEKIPFIREFAGSLYFHALKLD